MVLMVASGVFVEVLSSDKVTVFGEQAPQPNYSDQQSTLDKLKVARAVIFFSISLIEIYGGRMYTLLLLAVVCICCCITGDDSKLA